MKSKMKIKPKITTKINSITKTKFKTITGPKINKLLFILLLTALTFMFSTGCDEACIEWCLLTFCEDCVIKAETYCAGDCDPNTGECIPAEPREPYGPVDPPGCCGECDSSELCDSTGDEIDCESDGGCVLDIFYFVICSEEEPPGQGQQPGNCQTPSGQPSDIDAPPIINPQEPESPDNAPAPAPAPTPRPPLVLNVLAIELDKEEYAPGETIIVTVRNLPSHMYNVEAFVAIYNEGAAHNEYREYQYPDIGDSTLYFTAPDNTGNFEMRLYNQDYEYSDNTFELSVPFSVR